MKQAISIGCVILVLAGLLILPGCGARDVVTGDRNAGAWVDDKAIIIGIEEAFLEDDLIRFADFNAYSWDGHVYVLGLFTMQEQIDRAVEIARSFEGVRKVTTYFIRKGSGKQCIGPKRLEIGTSIRHKLLIDQEQWSSDITVDILQCTVVLLGYVDNAQDKAKAEQIAMSQDGVDTVKSYLMVRP